MKPDCVYDQLEAISSRGDDFAYLSDQLAMQWEADPEKDAFVEPILKFMETHPNLDYGVPGRLVHLLETLTRHEELVVESVQRTPMYYTVWMINRLINGKSKRSKAELIGVLEEISRNETIDRDIRELALEYADFQNEK